MRRRCGEWRPSLHWKGLFFIARASRLYRPRPRARPRGHGELPKQSRLASSVRRWLGAADAQAFPGYSRSRARPAVTARLPVRTHGRCGREVTATIPPGPAAHLSPESRPIGRHTESPSHGRGCQQLGGLRVTRADSEALIWVRLRLGGTLFKLPRRWRGPVTAPVAQRQPGPPPRELHTRLRVTDRLGLAGGRRPARGGQSVARPKSTVTRGSPSQYPSHGREISEALGRSES